MSAKLDGLSSLQIGIMALGTSCYDCKERPGLMIPVPAFTQYTSRALEYNLYKVFTLFRMPRDNCWRRCHFSYLLLYNVLIVPLQGGRLPMFVGAIPIISFLKNQFFRRLSPSLSSS